MEKATKIINNSPWPFARLISCHLICSNPESCPTSDSSCHLGQSCSPDELRSKRTASSADKCIRGQEPKAKCEMQALNPFFFHCSTSITFIISRCVRCRRFLNFSFCWASNVCAFLSFYLYFSPTLRWLFVQIEKRSQAVLIHLAAPFSN